MKKVILSLAIVALATVSANAQTEKGTWLLGGSVGFESSKVKDVDGSTTEVTVSPSAGYFVNNDLAVGLAVDVNSVKDSYTSIGAAPFVRYYFAPLSSNAKLFAQGQFGFGSRKPNGGDGLGFTNWEIKAGPAFFLTKSVALEVALAYGSMKFKDLNATNTFGLKAGFQVHLNNGGKK